MTYDVERIMENICRALTVLDPTGVYTFREKTEEEKLAERDAA